jgi:LuxR family maltose regulon positive regulatory protein
MRDYSEYSELKEDELKEHRDAYGVMIGKDYPVMEQGLLAGIYYERGDLLKAAHHASTGYHCCEDGMHPETIVSAHTLLSAVLYAMGALADADNVMEQTGDYIEDKAPFLLPNFKALHTERAIRSGDIDAAREWLLVYASRGSSLPFYQICRHFTTLRSYIAVEDYAAAASFGQRLHTLAVEYNRPLDQIESALLTAIALWHNNEKQEAVQQLGRALDIAMPYGFSQMFINESKEALPILWELQNTVDTSAAPFLHTVTQAVYKKLKLNPPDAPAPKLTEQQRTMLQYLSKGMTYSEIAAETGIGRATVKYHLLLVYKQLGVHDAEEAVVKSRVLGLLE